MPTEKSVREVAELEEDFKTSQLVIAANYRGLSVNQMQGIRRAVRQSNSQFKITKNTLARIAADNAGRPGLKELMGGPIGFLTTEGDPATAAKVLVNYIDDNKIEMTIIGGALEAEMLTQDRVIALAKLPSKEVLLAMLLGGMNRPITSLVMVMNGPVRALAIVLQRISELGASTAQTDEAAAAPTPEASAETEEAPAAEAGAPAVDEPATETTEAGPDADEQKTE